MRIADCDQGLDVTIWRGTTVGTRWIIDLAAECALSDSDLIDQAVALVFDLLAEWRVELRVCEGAFPAVQPHPRDLECYEREHAIALLPPSQVIATDV